MSDNKFFSISGVACVAHTPETRKLWQSIEGNRSDWGKQAILNYAVHLGFEHDKSKLDDVTKEAFSYLISKFPDVFGMKSHIIRKAIINYS